MPAAGEEEAGGAAAVKKAARKDAPLAFSTRKESSDGSKLELHKFESARQLQQSTDQGATRDERGGDCA